MAARVQGATDRTSRPARRTLALLAGPAAVFLLLFMLVPLLSLVRTSLYDSDKSFGGAGWSLRHYVRFLGDGFYVSVLGQTLVYGLIVSLFCVLVGFPLGYSLARMSPSARRWRIPMVILPLTLSLVVNVFGWLIILSRGGLVNKALLGLGLIDAPVQLLFSSFTVMLVMAQTFLPFMVLSIMSVVAQIDPALEQAAANLRAGRWTTLRRVVLPLALPGILAGSTLVFILTVSAFITPRLIGGTRVQMLGSMIYEQTLVVLNWPFGGAMSLILLAIVFMFVAGVNRLSRTRFSETRN
ncbi:MAG: ABC transporter permease [Alphaproteobacteria bacterium]|nr:ABC transporter permease [Alphaproteobacteria bacterium]